MTKPASSPSKRKRFEKQTSLNSGWRTRIILLVSLITTGGGVVVWLSFSNPHPGDSVSTDNASNAKFYAAESRTIEQLHAEVKQAFTEGNYAKGAELGRTLMGREGQAVAGQFIIAKALSHQSDVSEAVQLFKKIPRDHPRYGLAAGISAGELLLFRAKRLSAAAECFQEVLRVNPYHTQAHERLSYIYGVANLVWRAVPHRMALLCQQQFGAVHLLMLALGPLHEEEAASIQGFYAAESDDPLALYAMARLALRSNQTEAAASYLARVLKLHPEWPEPQAGYGSLLLQSGDSVRFQKWLSSLPTEAADNSEIWFLKGTSAQRQNDFRGAARCFAEAVRCEPNHQSAHFQLAQTLLILGETERAQPFLRQARLLEDLVVAVKMWQISHNRDDSIRRVMQIASELGLDWEAWSWQKLLKQSPLAKNLIPQPSEPPLSGASSLDEVLAAYRAARRNGEALAVSRRTFSDYPLPRLETIAATPNIATKSSDYGKIRFGDLSREAGLDFAYFNGRRPAGAAGEFMYEQTGGGVAVLDYDQDGWPDVYFTQGSDWPPTSGSSRYRDHLFRNIQGKRFEEVTDEAGIVEQGFGQGVSVGDFNQDGFPDLYVCNIGVNRLFRNNGDGTFTDITEQAGVGGKEWSTSSLLADFNGDTLPDLYVVTYIQGQNLFDRTCHLADGSTRLCTPYEFQATQDRLYLNLGDGSFRDVAAEAGLRAPNGKGLGVVAADFDNSGQLSLFVSNDTTPNFFFHNQTAKPGDMPRFQEKGFTSGMAVDSTGQSQASMGIACGDANGDGLLDLYVTNFYQEGSTLYLQQPGLIFSDLTRRAGLYQPSFSQLGFGTQFLDADLDGHLDLVVTNGHVGDLRAHGTPYQMPTQVFRNTGTGKFLEIPSQQLGKFFQDKHLGRGLARLDWNRDGFDDFVVNQLEEPAALLTNQTSTGNHSISIQLRGVRCSRDAIGTTVTVTCGGQKLMRQLTAGDGYYASNERRLNFGVGASKRIEKVEVRWPTGSTQIFSDLAVNSDYLLIENRSIPVLFPRPVKP